MNFVLKKNKGFKTLLKMLSNLIGEYEMGEDVNFTLILGQIELFKYVSITLCEGVLVNINLF